MSENQAAGSLGREIDSMCKWQGNASKEQLLQRLVSPWSTRVAVTEHVWVLPSLEESWNQCTLLHNRVS